MIETGSAFSRVASLVKHWSEIRARRNRFVCADCSCRESCGRPPTDDCVEAAMQIELHEENMRWMRGYSPSR